MRIPVPLPFRDRNRAYKTHTTEDEIRRAFRESRELDVPISVLRSTQRTIGADRLAQYESGLEAEPISVVERHGRLYIRNGHHRTTRALRAGERTIRARLAHVGDTKPIKLAEAMPGELWALAPHALAATYTPRDVEDVAEIVDGIAVLCIDGPLTDKPSWSWWSYFDDYESILCRFRSAIDSPDVRAVLLKIDSPGGSAAGLNECVDAMMLAKKASGKAVYAYADEGAYSAAYAIACVADKIYLPKAGGLGSIGVITEICDMTGAYERAGIRVEVVTSGARKGDGHPAKPITDAVIAHVQRRVDQLAALYFKLVKRARGIDAQVLEADTFFGKEAVRKGLADGVMPLSKLLASLDSIGSSGTRSEGTRVKNALSQKTTGAASMSRVLELTDAVARATRALAAASKAERPEAKRALAEANTRLQREMAKVVKDKKTVTTIHESESDSDDDDDDGDDAESESESESEEAADYESESESESESAAAREVLAAARKILGKTSSKDLIGALQAMVENNAASPKVQRTLARLEARDKAARLDALIAKGRAARKITPGNEPKVRKHAAEHGIKATKALIEALNPVLDAREFEPADAVEPTVAAITDEQKKIWAKMGYKDADYPKLAQAVQREQERASRGLPPARGAI